MAKHGKRIAALRKQVGSGDGVEHEVVDAIGKIKKAATAKFDETIEVAIRLGVDPRKSDQAVRGVCSMPSGTGKSVRVAVVCEGDNVAKAEKVGADKVGGDELIEAIGKGEIDFDVLIAEPGVMGRLSKHGKILGPKGLMPNPKTGTVSADVASAVEHAKAGQVTYRAERGGVIHAAIGKASFVEDQLAANFHALIDSVKKAKPAAAKGQYLVSAKLTSTMGPSLAVDLAPLR